VNLGKALLDLGISVYCAAFYAICRWYARDDGRMRRMAESRWRWERHISWKVRRGKISKEEYFDSFVRQSRRTVKWVFTPIVGVCVLALVVAAVQALVSG
jgi:hypothetical protein